ncbi:MarC family protein [Arenicella sp. 4NH20-0111]|uniref:MarC family protein n=1 Tax=Arenicella sp. 4NH20-0111 TaxID=3127648 RepID=UPI0031048865
MTIISAALLLFLVMDPLGNIPLFLTALKNVAPERRTKVILRELLIALLVMVIFLFSGQAFLSALHISEPALTATGGVILFLIALKMIFPPDSHGPHKNEEEPFIVPLAIPYIAGPSALATLLLIMNGEPERWADWLIALFAAWIVSGVILLLAGPLAKVLRNRGLIAIERLMGMILIAISIQMLLNGIQEFALELHTALLQNSN